MFEQSPIARRHGLLWNLAAATLLLAVIFFAGCKGSPTDSSNPNNTPQQITGEQYIQASIDGSYQTNQESSDGTASLVSAGCEGSYGSGSTPTYKVMEVYGFQRIVFNGLTPIPDTSYHSIQIMLLDHFPERPYGDKLYEMVSNPISFGSADNGTNGVEIRWFDASGNEWRSSWGSGDQSGSNFKFTSVDKIQYMAGIEWTGMYSTKGTFNCKIYDKIGNSKTVANGIFALKMIYFQ